MTSRPEPGHLLIVDDNKVNRILLARGLESYGHKVEAVENGRLALEKLRSDSFDLVLLDIEMPELNGYQVLETCLQDPDMRDIDLGALLRTRHQAYAVVKAFLSRYSASASRAA